MIRPATAADSPHLTAWRAQQSAPPAVNHEACLLAETDDQRLLGLLSYRIIDPDAAPVSLIGKLRRSWPCGRAQGHPDDVQRPRHIRLHGLLTEPDSAETATALLDALAAGLPAESITEARVAIAATDTAQQARYQALGFTPSLWLFQRPLPIPPSATNPESHIRPAARHDLPHLAVLLKAYLTGEEQRADFFRLRPGIDWQRLATAKRRCRDRILLVAEPAGQLSGFIDISLTPSTLSYLRSLARWGWNRLHGSHTAPPARLASHRQRPGHLHRPRSPAARHRRRPAASRRRSRLPARRYRITGADLGHQPRLTSLFPSPGPDPHQAGPAAALVIASDKMAVFHRRGSPHVH